VPDETSRPFATYERPLFSVLLSVTEGNIFLQSFPKKIMGRTTDGLRGRVRRSTSDKINKHIDALTRDNVEYFASIGSVAVESRLADLDREWDIERTLEINAAGFAWAGTILGAFVNRKWLVLPVVVTAFLAQHAIQGWCPPLPLLRALGIRTRREIDREKYALKLLRGDFNEIDNADEAWTAVK
jgi:hypothetical protein